MPDNEESQKPQPWPVDCTRCEEIKRNYPDLPEPGLYSSHYTFHVAAPQPQADAVDSNTLREVAKSQLSRAYYNGLDRKGWSLYEEKEAIDAIEAAARLTNTEKDKV